MLFWTIVLFYCAVVCINDVTNGFYVSLCVICHPTGRTTWLTVEVFCVFRSLFPLLCCVRYNSYWSYLFPVCKEATVVLLGLSEPRDFFLFCSVLCVSSLADGVLPVRMLVFRHIFHERMLLPEPGYTTIRCEFPENIPLKVCSKVRRPFFRAEIRGTYGMRVRTPVFMRIHIGLVGKGRIEMYCFARESLKFAGRGFVPILVFISLC